jgi:hypothetical protein
MYQNEELTINRMPDGFARLTRLGACLLWAAFLKITKVAQLLWYFSALKNVALGVF